MKSHFKKFFPQYSLLLTLLVTTIIYWPGLNGDFIFDDYTNIVFNEDLELSDLSLNELTKASGSGIASFIGRPLSMITFALNGYSSDFSPYTFKLTNLILHLLTGVSLYLFLSLLFKASRTSYNFPQSGRVSEKSAQTITIFITALWLIHPLNVSTVLYVVQRMTQLSALVVLLTLSLYLKLRIQNALKSTTLVFAYFSICFLILLGILAKENAALIPLYILLIEVFIFRLHFSNRSQRLFTSSILCTTLIFPGLFAGIFSLTNPEWIVSGYSMFEYSMLERLLTESRVLWLYAKWIMLPAIDNLSFFYDNFRHSDSLLKPVSTLVGILGWVVAISLSIFIQKKFPWLIFGLFFFLAAHSIESSIIPLELIFEHRNYLPSIGLLIAACLTAYQLMASYSSHKNPLLIIASLTFLAILLLATFSETRHWSNTPVHLHTLYERNPTSHRINYNLGYLYLSLGDFTGQPEYFEQAYSYYENSNKYNKQAIRGHIGQIMARSQQGLPVNDAVMVNLIQRLMEYPVEFFAKTDIETLIDCRYSGKCDFNKNLLARIFSAVAKNTSSTIPNIQNTLLNFAVKIRVIYSNNVDPLALLYLAENLSETTTAIDLQIIELEIINNNLSAASTQLDKALSKEKSDQFVEQLIYFQQLL